MVLPAGAMATMLGLGRAAIACALAGAALGGCGARSSLPDGADAAPEVCNGKDDDGNGLVDDVPPVACGTGACRREAPGCLGGKPTICEPGTPSAEVCNGVDDDCNGAVDDGLGFGTVSGPFDVADVPQGTLGLALAPTSSGLLALWALGFNGEMPFPNVLARPLGPDGKPTTDAFTLMQRTVPVGPRAHASAGGGVVFAACGRFGADDHAISGRTTPAGTMIGADIQRTPGDRWCGGVDPDVIWTGQRHLHVWATGSPADNLVVEVDLDIADQDGKSLESKVILSPVDSHAPPRLAALPDRVALVAGRAENGPDSHLFFVALDALGHAVGPEVLLSAPIAGGAWGSTEVAPSAAGDFVVFGANSFESGLFRARLSRDGEVLEAPVLVPGIDWRPDDLTLVARPGGGFVLAGDADGPNGLFRSFALALDDAGHVTDTWLTGPGDEPYFFRPSIAAYAGRVFVLYEGTPQPGQERLRIRELGCVP